MTTSGDVELRPATAADRDGIIALGARTLDWTDDERERAHFAWKHDQSPFGRSWAWVATSGGRVVAFRTFMPWTLRRGEQTLKLARAVDTATAPELQRQGLFRRLTLGALPALAEDGVDAVFNTPNRHSLPGYLRMGWTEVGRPTLSVVPRALTSLRAMARSRNEVAERWSEPTTVGEPALEALGRPGGWSHSSRAGAWETPRTGEYLRWRYGPELLDYRAIEVRGGVCVFRVRRRGHSREVALCEWLSAQPDPAAVRRLVRAAGDYVLGVGLSLPRHGAVALPRRGPLVAWRSLTAAPPPPLPELALGLGDLELF